MNVVFVLVICVGFVYGKVTPDYFPSCKRNDPLIEKCILDAAENLRPKLKEGIPELNIPALEPFLVPTLKLDRTAPNLRLKAVIKNIKAYGGSAYKIEKLKLHLNNKYAAEIKLVIPRLVVAGEYDVRGSRVLTLDINGKGKLRSNFSNIVVLAKGSARPIEKDGETFLHAEKIITKVKVGHGQISVDDSERPVAATSAAAFFNASPKVVLDILSPLIDETGAAVLKAFVNKILETIPLKEVLIEDASAA